MENEKTISIHDFALRWGIGDVAMRKAIKANKDTFPALRVGNRVRVLVDEADEWVKIHFANNR